MANSRVLVHQIYNTSLIRCIEELNKRLGREVKPWDILSISITHNNGFSMTAVIWDKEEFPKGENL